MIIAASGTATLVDGVGQEIVTDLATTGIYVLIVNGLTGVGMAAVPDSLMVIVTGKVLSTSAVAYLQVYTMLYGTPDPTIDWADDSGWVSPRIINPHTVTISLVATSWAGDVDWVLVKVQ